MQVSYETIYQALYVQTCGSLPADLDNMKCGSVPGPSGRPISPGSSAVMSFIRTGQGMGQGWWEAGTFGFTGCAGCH